MDAISEARSSTIVVNTVVNLTLRALLCLSVCRWPSRSQSAVPVTLPAIRAAKSRHRRISMDLARQMPADRREAQYQPYVGHSKATPKALLCVSSEVQTLCPTPPHTPARSCRLAKAVTCSPFGLWASGILR